MNRGFKIIERIAQKRFYPDYYNKRIGTNN